MSPTSSRLQPVQLKRAVALPSIVCRTPVAALSLPRLDGCEYSRVKDLVDVVLLRQAAFDDVEAVRRAVVRANGDDGSIERALEEPVCPQSGGEADGRVECW